MFGPGQECPGTGKVEKIENFPYDAGLSLDGTHIADAYGGGAYLYSLYYPVGGKDRSDYQSRLRNYFEHLSLSYQDIRREFGLEVWDGFMCHRCAYMQLECDIDRAG